MTIEDFNQVGFDAGDFVKITLQDGTNKLVQLKDGKAYSGHPSESSYTGQSKGREEVKPCIVIQNPSKPEGDGIPLEEVQEVILVKKM